MQIRAEISRHIRDELRGRRRVVFLLRRSTSIGGPWKGISPVSATGWRPPVPVASLGRRHAGAFFGRHIRGCSTNDVLGASEIVGQQLRDETEVEYHDPSLSGHEHIGRFDISMELSQAV